LQSILVGTRVGFFACVGDLVEVVAGDTVGRLVGIRVGLLMGAFVGDLDGGRVGNLVGGLLGALDGGSVGRLVGCFVGIRVGGSHVVIIFHDPMSGLTSGKSTSKDRVEME
jgi:hypothetical protein